MTENQKDYLFLILFISVTVVGTCVAGYMLNDMII
jgi:hypothetical protein